MKKIILALMLTFSVSFAYPLMVGTKYVSSLTVVSSNNYLQQTSSYPCGGTTNIFINTTLNSNTNYYTSYYVVSVGTVAYSTPKIYTCTYDLVTYKLQDTPIPICTQNQVLNVSTNKCDCKPGYKQDYTGLDDNNLQPTNTCSPKKICPPQMKYFWTDKATTIIGTQTEYTSCVPRTDLTPADCASQGGSYLTKSMMTEDLKDPTTAYILSNGEGCVNASWIASDTWWNNFSFLMSGFIIGGIKPFPASLANKAVTDKQLLLTYKNAASDVSLLKYEPDVVDLVMGADGVYADLGTVAKDASVDSSTLSAYNQYLKDNGYISSDGSLPNIPVNDLGISDSVSSAMGNMYKGGDEVKFSDNILGASKVADKADSFASMDTSLNIGATKTSTIDLSSLLNKSTDTKSYPVTSTLLDKTTSATGEVTTKTLSKINYPDGTYSNVTSLATKFADATTKYDITISTPIATTNGTKTIEQAYTVTKNATGATTNSIVTKEPTITYTGASGHTTTTSNTSTSTAPTDTNLASPLNLSNIQASLNQLNQTATDIKNLVKDLIEYVPANKANFDQALSNFDKGFNNFSLKLNDFTNFIGGFPPLIDNFKSQLDDLLAMFGDKPSLSLPGGQCPFHAHWYGKDFMVDPCLYVRPYRPIISVFLTFFATWVIFVFVIKYMFRIGLRGE